jgi:hypothetical protein
MKFSVLLLLAAVVSSCDLAKVPQNSQQAARELLSEVQIRANGARGCNSNELGSLLEEA